MSIKIVFADKVTFPVKGEIFDEAGKAIPFDFWLTAKRSDSQAIAEMSKDDTTSLNEALESLITSWQGVLDEDGKEVVFSTERFAQLLRIAGLASLIFEAYWAHVGARAKN